MNNYSMYTSQVPLNTALPKIVVLGLGGGGSNAINRMIESGMQGVTFIAANTDAQSLASNLAPNKINLVPNPLEAWGLVDCPSWVKMLPKKARKNWQAYYVARIWSF